MIDYETFQQIKLCKNKFDMNTQQIADSLNLTWATVDKWLKRERFSPKRRKARSLSSKLESFKESIAKHLLDCPDFSAVQIKQFIDTEGYTGGITILKEHLRKIRPGKKKAYLSLHFPPGESAQVDWGCAGYISIDGKKRKVSYFVIVLSHSRMMHVTFTLSEAQEFWLECHRHAFEYFGGVPAKILVDNCKTAVLSHPAKGEVKLNPTYIDFANHYGFEIVACNVRQPQEKGRVENGVGYVRKNFITGRKLEPFEMLNIDTKRWIDEIANQRIHGSTGRKPLEMFEEERKLLRPLAKQPYYGIRREIKKANKLFRIRFDSNSYSVPAEYVGKELRIHASCTKIRFLYEGSEVARHDRYFGKGKDIEDPAHPRQLIQQRQAADKNKSLQAFFNIGKGSQEYYLGLQERSLRPLTEVKKILVLKDKFSVELVQQALIDAAEHQAFSADYIKNILEHRHRILANPGPLHVPHKDDALHISLPEPDIDLYK